jgi:hypothetical protein
MASELQHHNIYAGEMVTKMLERNNKLHRLMVCYYNIGQIHTSDNTKVYNVLNIKSKPNQYSEETC